MTAHHPTHPLPQNGVTPIHIATVKGRTDVVKELISAGCDKNLPDKVMQMTPLPSPSRSLHFPRGCFRLLLESSNYQLLFVLLLRNSKYHETKVPNLLYVYSHITRPEWSNADLRRGVERASPGRDQGAD